MRAMKVDQNVTKGLLSHRTMKCSFLMIGRASRCLSPAEKIGFFSKYTFDLTKVCPPSPKKSYQNMNNSTRNLQNRACFFKPDEMSPRSGCYGENLQKCKYLSGISTVLHERGGRWGSSPSTSLADHQKLNIIQK